MNIDDTKPQISVIIPLYNKAPYIGRAIDSVISQTIQDFELIVVNDGSTDGGENIVAEYSDSRIFLINQKNSGVSVARNTGVNAAKADIVAFLDADDEWLPEFLETILSLVMKYPHAGIYATGSSYSYTGGKQEIQRVYGINDMHEGIVPHIFRIAAINRVFPGTASSSAVSKQVFLEVGGFVVGEKIAEDLDFFAKVCLHYPYVYYHHSLSLYHIDTENKATKNIQTFKTTSPPFLKTIESYSDTWLRENTEYEDLMLYIESLRLSEIKRQIVLGNKKGARENLQKIQRTELKLNKIAWYLATYLPVKLIPLLVRLYMDRKIPHF